MKESNSLSPLDRPHDLQRGALQLNRASLERRGENRGGGDGVVVDRRPLFDLLLPLAFDRGGRGRQGHEPCAREGLLDHLEPEVVIGMVVGDVDGGEVLTARADRVHEMSDYQDSCQVRARRASEQPRPW
jgi:hypothetical protein